MKKEQEILEQQFDGGSMIDRAKMLRYGELHSLCEMLIKDRNQLRRALDKRNQIEGKAHALFTEPLLTGARLLHTPDQCDPLGFVTVLRGALNEATQALAGCINVIGYNPPLDNPAVVLDQARRAMRSPYILPEKRRGK